MLSCLDRVDDNGKPIDTRIGVASAYLICVYGPLGGFAPPLISYYGFADSFPLPVLAGLLCVLPLIGAILGLTSLIRRIIHARSKLGALDEIIGFRWGLWSSFGAFFGILVVCIHIWLVVICSD